MDQFINWCIGRSSFFRALWEVDNHTIKDDTTTKEA